MTAVAVCGFGRCGSTMTMAMLDAGGVPPVARSQGRSYELASYFELSVLSSVDLEGHAVKLLDRRSWVFLPYDVADWRIVWLDRTASQQAASTVKFLRGVAGVDVPAGYQHKLRRSIRRERGPAIEWLSRHGELLILTYEEALASPYRAALKLRDFMEPSGLDLDVDAAAAVVHDRDGACLPDLAFETRGEVPARG